MRRSFTVGLLLLSVLGVGQASETTKQTEPAESRKSVIVLVAYGGWAPRAIDEAPRLVVYEDGEAITRRESGRRMRFFTGRVASDRLHAILRDIRNLTDYSRLRSFYDLSGGASDQPEVCIAIDLGNELYATVIRGLGPDRPKKNEQRPAELPEPLWRLYTGLYETSFPMRDSWAPDQICVVSYPSEHEPSDADCGWPSSWPTPKQVMTETGLDRYSTLLPYSLEKQVQKTLRACQGRLKIDDRSWWTHYRLVFPGEERWRVAFREALTDASSP